MTSLTFAIRTEKRLFLGTHHPATLDFKEEFLGSNLDYRRAQQRAVNSNG